MPINIPKKLMEQNTATYMPYYVGKMSYRLHGSEWNKFVRENFNDVTSQVTSENIFKDVIDLYAENLVPVREEFTGMKDNIVPLLTRGEAVAIYTSDNRLVWPERYEVMSDGDYTVAAVFTRSLLKQKDYCTVLDTEGTGTLYERPMVEDGTGDATAYKLVSEEPNHTLYHFTTGDKGMGAGLSSLQDRINHSIIDQTIIAEMYARPFWYLLNYNAPPTNPYLPASAQPSSKTMEEQDAGAAGRIFATSSEGPFGQLEPPTLGDMVSYHESLVHKVSQSWGIPEYYLRPQGGNAPSGTSLRVMSQRFNNRVKNLRASLELELMRLANDMQLRAEDGAELALWEDSNDLLQDSLDAHGLALTQMRMPRDYVAEVVAPGVEMEDYENDGYQDAPQSDPLMQRVLRNQE